MEIEIEPTVTKESSTRKLLKKIEAKRNRILSNEPEVKIEKKDTKEDITYKLLKAFNWYNAQFDRKQAKQWILDYIKSKNYSKSEISAIETSDNFFNSAGWASRLLNRNIERLPKRLTDYLEETILKMKDDGQSIISKQKEKIQKLQEGRKKIQENLANKAKENVDTCIYELEIEIDTFLETKKFKNDISAIKIIENRSLTKDQLKEVENYFEKSHVELKCAYDKTDEDFVEAYDNFTRQQLKKLIFFIEEIKSSCISLEQKAPEKPVIKRKQRQKKQKSPSLQVKKLQYLDKFNELQLTSISPEKIVGAEQLWVYNTKTRYLGLYMSNDSFGFTVKGSTIKNYNQTLSIEKKLRKPAETLKNILSGGKIILKKTLPELKTKQKSLTGRINKHTILLRVM